MPEIFNSANSPESSTHDVAPSDELEKTVRRVTTEQRRSRNVDEYSAVMRAEQPETNPFAAYAAKPVGTAFEAQEQEEQVLLLLRQSLITQVKHVFITIGLILVPLLFNYIGLLSFLPERFQLVALAGWYLIVMGYVLEVFLSWFYNVYIITDERIIDVDFISLLFKHVSYAKLDHIQDISATTSGALGAVFDYGDVKIQTAGTEANFEFLNVPHPSRVVSFLNEMVVEEEQEFFERRVH
jgi:hypothetical protein